MKVAVFGAAGFVGQNVVDALLEQKIAVVPSDITQQWGIYKANLVTDFGFVEEIVRECDAVVHLAASPLGVSLKEPLENAQVNIIGTLSLLRAMLKQNVKKIIFASASSVVGDVPQQSNSIPSISEDVVCTPKTPYAACKLAIESFLRVYHELFGIEYLTFRFFNVYGPGQVGGLIPAAYRTIANGKKFTITGNGTQVRDFVYVKDVAQFIVRSLTEDCTKWNETLNMGTGIPRTVTEIVTLVAQVLGIPAQIDFDRTASGEISNYVADTTKLHHLYGAVPSTSLEQGLEETIAWLKKQ